MTTRLTAKDFSSPAELQKYLKDHPDADKKEHKVVKRKPTVPNMKGTRARDIVPKRVAMRVVERYLAGLRETA